MTATNSTAREAVSHGFSITMNTKNTEELASGGQKHEYDSRHSEDKIDVDNGGGHLHEGDNRDPSDSVYSQQQRELVRAGRDDCAQQGDQQEQRETVQAGRDRYVQQGTSQEPKQEHPNETPSKENSKQISSDENEVLTGSSARHSSQGQSRSQQESSTKQRDSNREDYGRGQVIYINGRKEVIKSSDGRPYTEEQLRYYVHYRTLIENNYVEKDQFNKLEREYQVLQRLYKQENELLCSLQEDVLSRVDRYQPKSDAEIQKEFNDIKLAVLGFSKSLASNVTPDVLRQCLGELALSEDIDNEVWELNKRWNSKLLVESVIWSELYRGFLKDPFRVYGPSADYMITWRELFEEVPDRRLYPTASEMSEQWRVVTAKSLDALCHRDPSLSTDVAICTKRSLERRLEPIGYQPEQHKDELNHIIASAQKLAKTLSTQKARLKLFLPEIGERYSAKKVYDHKLEPANKHGDELESGEVLFVVVPGLRKWGDGNGHSLETFKDGIAAKVLISE